MKANIDYQYCLGKDKPECATCRRNIKLYEKDDIEYFWVDSYTLRNSKAKKCPLYIFIKLKVVEDV